ncbi:MAG: hypothetical protein LBJ37_19645 [Paucimonas sp.]|nr:hypothetical protein [Paucimonas sp.]
MSTIKTNFPLDTPIASQNKFKEVRVTRKTSRTPLKALEQECEEIQLLQLYEAEIKEKDEHIRLLEQEVERISSTMKQLEHKHSPQAGLTLNTGEEDDYFKDEILSTVIAALQDHLKRRTRTNSRKEHIISSIIENNPCSNIRETHSQKIKEHLRGYREMNRQIRKTLEEVGFSLNSEGRHWKITYQNDERYTYTLPKTGSDYRGGLNAAADISNIIF